jgi:hypothetical protein
VLFPAIDDLDAEIFFIGAPGIMNHDFAIFSFVGPKLGNIWTLLQAISVIYSVFIMFIVYLTIRKIERHILERFVVNNNHGNDNNNTNHSRNNNITTAASSSTPIPSPLETTRQLTMRSRRVMMKGILYTVSLVVPMAIMFFAKFLFRSERYWALMLFCIINPIQGLFNAIIYALPMILSHRDTSALSALVQCCQNVEVNCSLFIFSHRHGCCCYCCYRCCYLKNDSQQEPDLIRRSTFPPQYANLDPSNVTSSGGDIQEESSLVAESGLFQHHLLPCRSISCNDENETQEDKHTTSHRTRQQRQLYTIMEDKNLFDIDDASCGVATMVNNEFGTLHNGQQVNDPFSNVLDLDKDVNAQKDGDHR